VSIAQIIHISTFIQFFSNDNILFLFSSAWFIISKHPEIGSYSNKSNIGYNCDRHIVVSNPKRMNDFSIQFVAPIVFRSNGNSTNRQNQLFLDKFKSAFVAIHFTHLNINCENICIKMLLSTHVMNRLIHLSGYSVQHRITSVIF